jgi:anti-anti-sigma regulatory factor
MRIVLPSRTQAPQVEEILSQLRAVSEAERLEVDGAAVTHVDFAGLQLLLSMRKREAVQFTSSPVIDAALDLLALGGSHGANSGSR